MLNTNLVYWQVAVIHHIFINFWGDLWFHKAESISQIYKVCDCVLELPIILFVGTYILASVLSSLLIHNNLEKLLIKPTAFVGKLFP